MCTNVIFATKLKDRFLAPVVVLIIFHCLHYTLNGTDFWYNNTSNLTDFFFTFGVKSPLFQTKGLYRTDLFETILTMRFQVLSYHSFSMLVKDVSWV